MRLQLLLFFCLFAYGTAQSQAPFTTLSVEPRYVKADTTSGGKIVFQEFDMKGYKNELNEIKDSFANNSIDTVTNQKKLENIQKEGKGVQSTDSADSKDVNFFKNNSLALSILKEGDNRMSVNSQVVSYKINIFTRKDSDSSSNKKYNIPLMIISKLSTSYDSISGASALDVLDYEAAPVTMRIMPSFKVSSNKIYQEVWTVGFYADARGINIQNPETNDYDLKMVGSGGIGFTVRGSGEGGIYDEKGELEKGKWLVSAMLQGAFGEKETIQGLFDTEKDYVTSFQSYFVFRITENSKFNLKVGYQHFFQETVGGTKNNFSVAIGL